MDTISVVQLFWVVIFFFSIIILFFVWAKAVVITRIFSRVKVLLGKMNTLYDEEEVEK